MAVSESGPQPPFAWCQQAWRCSDLNGGGSSLKLSPPVHAPRVQRAVRGEGLRHESTMPAPHVQGRWEAGLPPGCTPGPGWSGASAGTGRVGMDDDPTEPATACPLDCRPCVSVEPSTLRRPKDAPASPRPAVPAATCCRPPASSSFAGRSCQVRRCAGSASGAWLCVRQERHVLCVRAEAGPGARGSQAAGACAPCVACVRVRMRVLGCVAGRGLGSCYVGQPAQQGEVLLRSPQVVRGTARAVGSRCPLQSLWCLALCCTAVTWAMLCCAGCAGV